MNEIMNKSETLTGNGKLCECFKVHTRDVMLQDYFNGWVYDSLDIHMSMI
jgi:hypothetical protein